MARLPDRFDLWVRKARECGDPSRQADYLLGALTGLKAWHFLNVGTKENPQPAETEIESARYLLVFSNPDRIEELLRDGGQFQASAPLPVIAMATAEAMPWCVKQRATGGAGLLVNPGEEAFLLPMDHLEAFHSEWENRAGRQAAAFWIPNMTTEEEDFWQEHGL
jgi:hypothetical protein